MKCEIVFFCVSALILIDITSHVYAQRQQGGKGQTQGGGQGSNRGVDAQPQNPGQITPTGVQPKDPGSSDQDHSYEYHDDRDGDDLEHRGKNGDHDMGVASEETDKEPDGKSSEGGESTPGQPGGSKTGGKDDGNRVDATEAGPRGGAGGRRERT